MDRHQPISTRLTVTITHSIATARVMFRIHKALSTKILFDPNTSPGIQAELAAFSPFYWEGNGLRPFKVAQLGMQAPASNSSISLVTILPQRYALTANICLLKKYTLCIFLKKPSPNFPNGEIFIWLYVSMILCFNLYSSNYTCVGNRVLRHMFTLRPLDCKFLEGSFCHISLPPICRGFLLCHGQCQTFCGHNIL